MSFFFRSFASFSSAAFFLLSDFLEAPFDFPFFPDFFLAMLNSFLFAFKANY